MSFACILVVEDDPLMMRVLRRMLESRCQELIEAVDAPSAIARLCATDLPPVDMVLTDVGLPQGSGIDVAVAAAALRPPPVVIAMSGAATAADGLALGHAGVAGFLAKPFTRDDLIELVDGLAERNPVELEVVVRRVVGEWAMPEILDSVRRTMVFEALTRAQGNKAQAAQLLGISRQHLQNILSRGKV